MTRVAIVADSALLRGGIASVLATDPTLLVVASITSAGGAYQSMSTTMSASDVSELVAEVEPDIVVWAPNEDRAADDNDLSDVEWDGDVAVAPIVVVLSRISPTIVRQLLRSGLRGVLAMDADDAQLLGAVHAAAAGLTVMPSRFVDAMLDEIDEESASVELEHATAEASPLTPRETEVLALLATGSANKVIAAQLGISAHTVKAHIAAIYDKLDAGTRTEAVMSAARRGVIML